MNHSDILRVFTYIPLTAEQEADLEAVHTATANLASTLYTVLNMAAAQQAIGQLTTILALARNQIELSPRQSSGKIVTMS